MQAANQAAIVQMLSARYRCHDLMRVLSATQGVALVSLLALSTLLDPLHCVLRCAVLGGVLLRCCSCSLARRAAAAGEQAFVE